MISLLVNISNLIFFSRYFESNKLHLEMHSLEAIVFIYFLIDDVTFEPVRENEESHEDVDLAEVVCFFP